MRGLPLLLLFLALAVGLSACGESEGPATKAGDGDPERGRQVYLAQCIACHNTDPSKNGPLGPAIKGSSPGLLEAKLLRGSYPPGYAPKRDTAIMPPQSQMAPYIPDLAAYLR